MKTEKNILIAFILNLGFSIFEIFGGLFTGSIAILTDSIHDFGDALSIGLSYFLEKISKKKPNKTHTYGYIRYSVIGSLITSTILLVGSVFVVVESIKRMLNPVMINYNGMLIIAFIGVVVNFAAVYFTREGDSLNQKAVNLHMLEDVLGWVVVLIGSIIMRFTSISLIDPILSILVAMYILYHVARNIKEIVDLFLEKTPKEIDIDEVKKHLLEVKGVKDVHHIHMRSTDGYHIFATLHAVVEKYDSGIKKALKEELQEHGVDHSTIELELENEDCHDENCDIQPKRATHHHHHS